MSGLICSQVSGLIGPPRGVSFGLYLFYEKDKTSYLDLELFVVGESAGYSQHDLCALCLVETGGKVGDILLGDGARRQPLTQKLRVNPMHRDSFQGVKF